MALTESNPTLAWARLLISHPLTQARQSQKVFDSFDGRGVVEPPQVVSQPLVAVLLFAEGHLSVGNEIGVPIEVRDHQMRNEIREGWRFGQNEPLLSRRAQAKMVLRKLVKVPGDTTFRFTNQGERLWEVFGNLDLNPVFVFDGAAIWAGNMNWQPPR